MQATLGVFGSEKMDQLDELWMLHIGSWEIEPFREINTLPCLLKILL